MFNGKLSKVCATKIKPPVISLDVTPDSVSWTYSNFTYENGGTNYTTTETITGIDTDIDLSFSGADAGISMMIYVNDTLVSYGGTITVSDGDEIYVVYLNYRGSSYTQNLIVTNTTDSNTVISDTNLNLIEVGYGDA